MPQGRQATVHRPGTGFVKECFHFENVGAVTRYTIEDYRADAWKNGHGKGEDSGTADSGSSEQYQQRYKVLTNREVLEMAVDELEVSDLTPGERSALDIGTSIKAAKS